MKDEGRVTNDGDIGRGKVFHRAPAFAKYQKMFFLAAGTATTYGMINVLISPT